MNPISHTRFAFLTHTNSLRMLLLLAALLLGAVVAIAQTTLFTYQGRLNDGNSAANGSYDFQFKLFDAATAGNQVGITNALNGIVVTGGGFTVSLDFGAAAFPGADRWLEISVKPPNSNSFILLTSRHRVTATPYAIKSLNAATADGLSTACSGCVTDAQIGGVAASKLTGALPVASVPDLSGNYIKNATTAQALSNFNISGNGTVGGTLTAGTVNSGALRQELTSSAPNIINGFLGTGSGGATPGNRVTDGVVGATIAGGGFNGTVGFLSGDNNNRVTDWFGTVGGGARNIAGNDNVSLIDATFATVSGGLNNIASEDGATVGGGVGNRASALNATVGGGYSNIASGVNATVPGGTLNTASGDNSFAAGLFAKALHNGAFVWGDSTLADFTSTGNDQFLIRASGGVGIGTNDPKDALHVMGDIRVGTGSTGCVKDADGTVLTGTCSSDLSFKKDITPFPSLLNKFAQLRPVHFYWRSAEFPGKRFGTERSYGLIAQEVEQVLPELVTKDEQGYEAVNYSKLPLLTIQAVKELKAENDSLKQQNAALETRLAALEHAMQQIKQQLTPQAEKQPKQ